MTNIFFDEKTINALFAPRKRTRSNEKFRIDIFHGLARVILCSTGRIVGVFEKPMDAVRFKTIMNNTT